MKRDMPPVHPGEILLEDFLRPMGITQYRLAKDSLKNNFTFWCADPARLAALLVGWIARYSPFSRLATQAPRHLKMWIYFFVIPKSIGVPQGRIGEIVAGKRSVTADTALRLARFFKTDAQSWMNLQTHYDLVIAEEKLSKELEKEALIAWRPDQNDRCPFIQSLKTWSFGPGQRP